MKILTSILFFVACIINGGYCQTGAGGEYGDEIPLWLKPGKHTADIMSIKSTISARQVELTGKVLKAMKTNAAWFRDSMENIPDSSIIYEKFGLTKEEFEEYVSLNEAKSKNHQLIKTGEERLVIKRKRNTLTFRGTGRLKHLDSLKFNIPLNVALYNAKELVFSNKSGSEDTDNPFKSPWMGYHYSYENEVDFLDNSDVNSLTTMKITFDIGQVKNTGKTVLMFMAMKIENGKPVQNITSICMFE